MEKVNVGIVGCGNICKQIYGSNLTDLFASNINVVACSDLNVDMAKDIATTYNIPSVMTFDEIISSADIELVVILTPPALHYRLTKQSLEAGKHTYLEKPLALNYEEGCELVALAKSKGLLLGCAPDTFMGAGLQTAKKLIEDGMIGKVIGATGFMTGGGPEWWHPNPEFFYKKGAGPMFDMGPYYLSALINLLGPIKEIAGMNILSRKERTINSKPLKGKVMQVEVATHVASLLRFKSGAIGNLITSFDVPASTLPKIEIYGTEGSMLIGDPNGFQGPVSVASYYDRNFKEMPLLYPYNENSRGLGISNMAEAIRTGSSHLASGELALHVLEAICAIIDTDRSRKYYKMKSKAPTLNLLSK